MTNVKLSSRLLAIAGMIDNGSVVADIGCDHALLDIYLLNNNIIKQAVACDVTVGSINKAKENVKAYNTKNIEIRLADGFDGLNKNDKITTIVISGLGGKKIISFFKDTKVISNVKDIIIQANTDIPFLRKNMSVLGYKIVDEQLVECKNIIYTIIKFEKGNKKYTKNELYFGPMLLKNKDDLFIKKMMLEINTNVNIINNLPYNKILKKISLKLLIYKLKKEIR